MRAVRVSAPMVSVKSLCSFPNWIICCCMCGGGVVVVVGGVGVSSVGGVGVVVVVVVVVREWRLVLGRFWVPQGRVGRLWLCWVGSSVAQRVMRRLHVLGVGWLGGGDHCSVGGVFLVRNPVCVVLLSILSWYIQGPGS